METMDFVYDPFCEKAFWANNHNNIDKNMQGFSGFMTNPMCAITGALIFFMVIFSSNIDHKNDSTVKPCGGGGDFTLFALCRASLALVGAGTVVFHSMDDQTGIKAFNFRMCDRMPIVLMCTNIFLLYFTKLHVNMSGYTLSLCFLLVYLYMSGLILAVDSATYEHLTLKLNHPINNSDNPQNVYETYMNVALLCPVGAILAYAMKYHPESYSYFVSLWLMIGGNLVMWALNAYLCRAHTVMFVLHAVYHVTIAYTFLFAACVGMTFDGGWDLRMYAFCWPVVVKKENNQTNAQCDKKDPCNLIIPRSLALP